MKSTAPNGANDGERGAESSRARISAHETRGQEEEYREALADSAEKRRNV